MAHLLVVVGTREPATMKRVSSAHHWDQNVAAHLCLRRRWSHFCWSSVSAALWNVFLQSDRKHSWMKRPQLRLQQVFRKVPSFGFESGKTRWCFLSTGNQVGAQMMLGSALSQCSASWVNWSLSCSNVFFLLVER